MPEEDQLIFSTQETTVRFSVTFLNNAVKVRETCQDYCQVPVMIKVKVQSFEVKKKCIKCFSYKLQSIFVKFEGNIYGLCN